METLIVIWIKWTGMVKIKRKDFIDAVPIIPCQNSSWIMGLRIYGEGRIDRVYTDIKIVKNTKINHIMVSFADHYNVISIDRLCSKTKIGKVSWYFKNSLLSKPEYSTATITFLFLLKKNTQKKQIFSKWLVGKHQI